MLDAGAEVGLKLPQTSQGNAIAQGCGYGRYAGEQVVEGGCDRVNICGRCTFTVIEVLFDRRVSWGEQVSVSLFRAGGKVASNAEVYQHY